MSTLTRRSVLGGLCSCSAVTLAACHPANAPEGPISAGYRPSLTSEEGGLWEEMDKAEHETRISRFRIRDAELDAYVKEIVCRLAAQQCADVRVYVMRVPYFNAEAAPNGMILVWSGLLLRTQNEAQFAAILGHELGHYIQRHSLQRMREIRDKASAAAWLGASFGAAGGLAGLALLGGIPGFSRDQEREADRIGFELMTKAGYRPSEVPRIWQNVIAERDSDPEHKERDVFFKAHPDPEERETTLRRLADAAGPIGDTYVERYQGQIRSLRGSMLEDELKLREYPRTLVVLQEIVATVGEDGEIAYYTGEVYRQRDGTGDAKKAREAYERAIALGGFPPELHRSLGLMQMRAGEKVQAQQSFARYLQLRPEASDRAMIQTYLKPQGS
ncbi:MAG TPA: M48 family metallopeptidase [Stellaceae bacterium]|nr:M48 family metallopeptidase [Stellaceae bacterium]